MKKDNVGKCGHAKCAGGDGCFEKGKPMAIYKRDDLDIEITHDEVILDDSLYNALGKETQLDASHFKVGDSIIYFRGNNTWRAEVVGKKETGYMVRDY